MIKNILITILLFSNCLINAQEDAFYDGPNIFYGNDSLVIKYAIDSTAYIHKVKQKNKTVFSGYYKDSIKTYTIPKRFKKDRQKYSNKSKIFVISDIHGQYDIFKKLLLNNDVIDSNNSWKWGKGHLIILGDLFDKGNMVHETAWLVYELEKQAKKVGGKVHFILGNHDVKALRGDLKYVTENYFQLADILSISIPDLYKNNTFWGRWLRSKNVIIKIGDLLFTHGGIHPQIISENYSIRKINRLMRANIDLSLEEIKLDPTLSFLFRKNGPIRYRGFFRPDRMPEVSNDQLYTMLKHFGVKRIIVGHTTHEHITNTFNNKVIGVDGGINIGLSGEALLIMKDKYYITNIYGKKTQIL